MASAAPVGPQGPSARGLGKERGYPPRTGGAFPASAERIRQGPRHPPAGLYPGQGPPRGGGHPPPRTTPLPPPWPGPRGLAMRRVRPGPAPPSGGRPPCDGPAPGHHGSHRTRTAPRHPGPLRPEPCKPVHTMPYPRPGASAPCRPTSGVRRPPSRNVGSTVERPADDTTDQPAPKARTPRDGTRPRSGGGGVRSRADPFSVRGRFSPFPVYNASFM